MALKLLRGLGYAAVLAVMLPVVLPLVVLTGAWTVAISPGAVLAVWMASQDRGCPNGPYDTSPGFPNGAGV